MKDVLIQYMKRFSDLSESELKKLTVDVPVASFKKGTILLHQGDIPDECYFVLKGCVRQYGVDENGNEHTYNFFTEEQSVTIFNLHTTDKASPYSLSCLEDCTLVVGDLSTEQENYDMNPVLEMMTRKMIEEDMGAMRDDFSSFISSTPEERYQALMEKRPGLIDRVPQYQLASYLGIKPESLSRIKKRSASHLRIVD
ncbi:cAMP-binding domain of CRP or a regulatory subunit of cAMP-dependent protein kinases [Halobacillus alkaliphilus]|uniref:cAMP-binding domain of CRP or a regulatory subunit of cAMP-dependent protein kinases n=1 Tax=Halobacillus alkaliphilus TaxID=396056 RepID=A0A1I2QTF2_9BACI|nr:Crp/Fnr family transcriptional regulator [Halobacillus alkaliphilus]SFG31875.1 cAMP-binding domain of CRP or a regulatory subunit of cAMP-dependent protein kinases [Halobacillus alkaliphilus]